MKRGKLGPTSAVVLSVLLLAGCAVGPSGVSATPRPSAHLAPTFGPLSAHGSAAAKPSRSNTQRPHGPRSTRRTGSVGPVPSPASSPRSQPSAATVPELTASLVDPTGDVSPAVPVPPGHVDIKSAVLERSSTGFRLTVGFGGDLPTRMGADGNTENVVLFADVDGDGRIDYEIMGSLSDTGWVGAWRYPSGSKFGTESQVKPRASGSHLVITFPLDRLGSSSRFRWAVSSEWGSYSQVASGTTATDHAPDRGAVAFPS